MQKTFKTSALIALLFLAKLVNAQTATDWFITEWNTALSPTPTQITFRGYGTNYVLQIQPVTNGVPGAFGPLITASTPYTFAGLTSGVYRIRAHSGVSGSLVRYNPGSVNPTIFNGNQPDPSDAFTKIIQWGNTAWQSTQSLPLSFGYNRNLDIVATDIPNFAGVSYATAMFTFDTSLVGNSTMNSWTFAPASTTTNLIMNNMFSNTYNFNQNISGWNVGNVSSMNGMFSNARKFNQPINSWNVSGVTDMGGMFSNAWAFNQPLDSWSVSSVFNMGSMFSNARAFDQNLGAWTLRNLDVGPSTNTGSGMFSNSGLSCVNYTNTLNGWAANPATASNVTFTGQTGREYGDQAARALLAGKGWTFSGDTYNSTCGGVLPVSFGSIQATLSNGLLVVNWQTLSETNNAWFEIQTSTDGENFKTVAKEKSVAIEGNSSTPLNYTKTIDNSSSTVAMGISLFVLAITLLFVTKRNKTLLKGFVAILLVAGFSCTKSDKSVATNKTEKLFVRILQVDKDGTQKASKAVQVTVDL